MMNLLWLIPLGFIVGNIINHLADILPIYRTINFKPICFECKQMFELSNYITFRICPNCKRKPSIRRKVVIGLSLITVPFVFYFPPDITGWLLAEFIFTFFAVVFIIDLEHRLILHPVSIFGAIAFIIIGFYINGWKETVLGGLIGFGIMYLLYLLGILFGKWMSRRRGEEIDEVALGFGDVALSTMLGFLLGWPRIAVNLVFAILLGGIFSAFFLVILTLLKRYKAFTPIPYAPFLLVSAVGLLYLATTS
jgi:leader peptidase (prepilin peptidase)/N-methyltransferase